MPEGIEIEIYRRAAEPVVGRTVKVVSAPDAWYIKGGGDPDEIVAAMTGRMITGLRRRGKLMIVDFDEGDEGGKGDEGDKGDEDPVRLGLRFGMTGRLVVDGVAAIHHLEYSTRRSDPAWIRFGLSFVGGGDMVIFDPRRLGGVELNPDEDRLGVDLFSPDPEIMRERVFVGRVALKARLLDQSRVAGIGNLIADEVLWRVGIDPARPAGDLEPSEQEKLIEVLASTLEDLMAQGGSHTGRLQEARVRGGHCPVDGTELDRRAIGGRTTYSCPTHQV